MGKFVVVYKGGAMAESPETQEAIMGKWMAWFGSLGPAVTDFGNPFGASMSLEADGAVGDASTSLTGYTIVEAQSLQHAGELVTSCPVFEAGGSVEVFEALAM